MKIAIIGHGNVGGARAQKWSKKGHEIIIGARNVHDQKVQNLLRLDNITAKTVAEAAKLCDVILVATPAHIVPELIDQVGNIAGKVVIDATNAIQKKPSPYPTAYHAFKDQSGAEVVKCFNTTGFENMLNPSYDLAALDMFMAGDDNKAKEVAIQLALDCGFEQCIDFGGADKVELLEKFALSWINLAILQGHGRDIGFKLLRR
ncbi:NAD(P)-binding domain-containing protein [Fulvivirgaceae bacterium BMA10]|uniref:NAD(P)-binding domain-containing protein n=1 Tax=Splendidivirga corallicola TaxID=3051826 RepID=A0ABT8KRY6_9BACT|nr:NAD(P)-binding domain-containing protein [Fulvivirgaceae bacterium BMA10]